MKSATRTTGSPRGHLKSRQLDEFRSALEQQRMFRTEQLAELVAAAQSSATSRTDRADGEIADALRAGATTALGDIESALRRIVTGTFGTCTACGDAIPTERLEILPMAALCMPCARPEQNESVADDHPRQRRTVAIRQLEAGRDRLQ